MSSTVLDASAVMAILNHEPGEAAVEAAIVAGAAMSTVNYSEVVAKLAERDIPAHQIRRTLAPLELELFEFDLEAGVAAGLLRNATRHQGVSFGDRACVALGLKLGLPVLTGDRRWAALEQLGVEVRLIR